MHSISPTGANDDASRVVSQAQHRPLKYVASSNSLCKTARGRGEHLARASASPE